MGSIATGSETAAGCGLPDAQWCGQYGNGYGWEGVARSAVRHRAPELGGRFAYDCEAGMFVAYGTDREALRKLGALLRDAYRDDALLRDLIDSGDPDEFD